VFTVIDRAEMIEAQQLSQPARVDLVTLVALSHRGILSRIAHHQFRHVWFQQVIQPSRRGSFFEGDLQVSAQPIDKLAESCWLWSRSRSPSRSFPHHSSPQSKCFPCAHPYRYTFCYRLRAFLSVGVEASTQTLLQKGRPFILRRVAGQ
jgi:hypothetical protein